MSSSFPVWKSSCSDYPSFDSLVESTVDVGVAHSTEKTPFTINKSANATISIAHVETPLSLKVDCLTHPISSSVKGVSASFKHLSNRAGSDLVRELSHKVEQIHIDHGHNRLHTSDVVVTTGGLLNAKFVLHVVAAAHTKNYETAMTNSLSACYVRILEAAVEQCKGKTLAICGLADRLIRGGFDQVEATHIGLRTIKRFLVKYPNKFDKIIFVTGDSEKYCNQVISEIAPLYFPRTREEQIFSSHTFQKKSPGDLTGAYESSNRRVRVGGAVLDAGEAASPIPNPQRQAALRKAALETPPASASKFKLRDFPQLSKWSRGKTCLRIQSTFNTRDDNGISTGSLYTLYSIRVAEDPTLPGYTVWRRYSEFLNLRNAILEEATNRQSSILCILATTPFPPKVWFGSMDTDVIEERKNVLDGYLRMLASTCTEQAMMQLRGFLTPTDADVERCQLEEEEDDDEDDEDDGVGGENVITFVKNLQDPLDARKQHERNKKKQQRKALGNLENSASSTMTRAIARPSDTLKMKRKVREAASGKSNYGDRRNEYNNDNNNNNNNDNKTSTKTRRYSGPRMHRAEVGIIDQNYVAEGNRFITNDLL